jgi:hypothetical protein
VAFTVIASGSAPLSYQWQFNSNDLAGATDATLTLTNTQPDQAGSYSVVVTNVAGTAISSNAVLRVIGPTSPWAAAIVVHLVNDSGQDIYDTLSSSVPFVTDFKGTNDVTITELAGVLLPDYIDSFGGVYGSENPSYITNFVGATSNGTGDGMPGDLEDIQTSLGLTIEFDFASRLTPNDHLFLIDCDWVEQYHIQAFIKSGTNYAAESLVNWKVQNFPGSTGEIPNKTFPLWDGTNGLLVSQTSNLNLNEPLTVFTPDQTVDRVIVSQTAGAGGSGSATLQFIHPFVPNAAPILPFIPTQTVDELTLLTVTNTATDPNSDATLGYTLINSPAGVAISSNGVITWTPTQVQSPSTNLITTIATSFDSLDPVNPELSVTNSFTVIVIVPATPPIIVQEPVGVFTNQGANVAFTVVATGSSPLSYQWQFGTTNMPGQTNATLLLPDVLLSQSGPYSVLVSNGAGSTPSSNAVLIVYGPPIIVQPPQNITANSGATATFTVVATSLVPMSYQWESNGLKILGATDSMLTLRGIQTNAQGSYSVIVSNPAGSTNSSPAILKVIVPTSPPIITLSSPANLTAYCVNDSIPLQASLSSNALAPTSIALFYGSTNLLGSVSNSPYSFVWTNASAGTYSLTATAAFSDGSTITSSPATVSVSSQCGQGLIAIVRNTDDPEIGLLRSNLFEIGYGSVVFDPSNLTAGSLAGFIVVIWDDLNGQANQITDNTVSVLGQVYSNGMPLYLIGGGTLASDQLALDTPQRFQWSQLTSLTPATGKTGDGNVEITQTMYEVLSTNYGTFTNFSDATSFDSTTVTNADASVLAQSGTTPVMVAIPGYDVADSGLTRLITQNFEVGGGNDPDSLAQRHTLFLDGICWLTGCQACTFGGWGFNSAAPAYSPAGKPLTNSWSLVNVRSCNYTGTTLTAVLPSGVEFVGAQSSFGSWHYDNTNREVIFDVGLLPSFTNEEARMTGSFTVIPEQPGMLPSTMTATINGQTPQQSQAITQVNGLTLSPAGNNTYNLTLLGIPDQNYDILTSANLTNWTILTNVPGPDWSTSLQPSDSQLFFDASTNQQTSP